MTLGDPARLRAAARLARLDDVPSLAELDPWPTEDVWPRLIANGEVIALQAGDDGVLLGLARYSVLWTTVPFLGLIVVREDVRGRGLSRLLLTGLCDHLRSRGFVALLSSSQTNEPGPQAWHRRMGFHTNGIIENIAEEGVGELVFRKLL